MHSMNRTWLLPPLAILISCSGPASALTDQFILCNERTGDPTIVIDHQSLWTRVEDMESKLEFCNYVRGCLIYPFVISEPPGYPSTGEELTNWTIGEYHLEIRSGQSESRFTIDVSYPAIYSLDNRRREIITYDTSLGVVEISIQNGRSFTNLVKCSGRLTFADIEAARTSGRQPTPDPPSWN